MFAAVEQCSNHVFAHHALSDTESRRYGGGVETVDLVHDEGFAALGGHGLDQPFKQA
jgi:hypothetical protein